MIIVFDKAFRKHFLSPFKGMAHIPPCEIVQISAGIGAGSPIFRQRNMLDGARHHRLCQSNTEGPTRYS